MKIKQTGFYSKKKRGQTVKMVCFNCRKCFHKHMSECVECKGAIYNVGGFFTAPRKHNLKEWKILEKLVIQGNYHFSKYGATGPMADTPRQADNIILKMIKSKEPQLFKRRKAKDVNGNLVPQTLLWTNI